MICLNRRGFNNMMKVSTVYPKRDPVIFYQGLRILFSVHVIKGQSKIAVQPFILLRGKRKASKGADEKELRLYDHCSQCCLKEAEALRR